MNGQKSGGLSTRVIKAVADHTGMEPESLPTPLADVIDPDALDHLFRGRDTEGEVRFVYGGLRVRVSSD